MNPICDLFGIQKPLIQAGMVWCSGWRLASAVSKSGGLGVIGSGSMYPTTLREHIQKCRKATTKPFGVNVPLLYPQIDELLDVLISEKVKIVITSAGDPAKYTDRLKDAGIVVAHVVSSVKFALKAERCGVDVVIAEGFEAGGHNGRDETTTLCLVPEVVKYVQLPVVAAGGIGSGRAMLAAFALGAQGVQIGSMFAASEESSAHLNFKQALLGAGEGDTKLMLKKLAPVRLLKNRFRDEVETAESAGLGAADLAILLGRGRAKKGIFEGDLEEGELEIGQVAAAIDRIRPAAEIVEDIWSEFLSAKNDLLNLDFA